MSEKMNETNQMIAEAMYTTLFYNWQYEGNYHVGESIKETEQFFRDNEIELLSYDMAINFIGTAILIDIDASNSGNKNSRAIAPQLFIYAHGYVSFAHGKSAKDIFMDLFRYVFNKK